MDAQLDMLHGDEIRRTVNIIALQEPYLDPKTSLTRALPSWRVIYPPTHGKDGAGRTRSILFIRKTISTNDWAQVAIPSPDVTAIRLRTATGWILLVNAYIPCDNNAPISLIDRAIENFRERESIILLGDFNRHHPRWDEERNAHLFTNANLDLAEPLLNLVGRHGLEMTLAKDLPTLQSTASKNYTRPDNVPARIQRWDWHKADWEKYNEALELGLADLPRRRVVRDQTVLNARVVDLERVIWAAVEASVPAVVVTPYSKRWWTPDLTKTRRKVRKLAKRSYKLREFQDLKIHSQFRAERNQYTQDIRAAKRAHWESFLAELTGDQVWTAGNYITEEPTDGGTAHVPDLRTISDDGSEQIAASNEDKSRALLNAFFPPPAPELPEFHSAVPASPAVSDLKLLHTGPDGLPACVYKYGADLLVPHLLPVFRASLRLGIYPAAWRKSRTVVLRKPGKPDYSVPKAYRPIALLNVVSKILSACVATRLNILADKYQWFPDHHFGGRAGCNTTDAIHTAVKAIKDAWARGQVASGLFLDVKGAFPHADPRRLARNMQDMGVPGGYINWMLTKLDGRVTSLAFDDYVSPELPILNGIDQGCPLSVFFYLTYNSPLIRVPKPRANELSIGYIDDVTFIAWGKTFEETHEALADIMSRQGGALEWLVSHNSTFELDKTACIDFSQGREPAPGRASQTQPLTRRDLAWGDHRVKTVAQHVFLGVLLDQELRWTSHSFRALARGVAWASQLGRLARANHGISPGLARKLYVSIAIPRFTYAADVWFKPVTLRADTKGSGSIGMAHRLARVQRTAALSILGGLRSTPTTSLDAHARLLPMHLLLNRACERAALRLASVPVSHPLYTAVIKSACGQKAHRTPLHEILALLGINPALISAQQARKPLITTPERIFPAKQEAGDLAASDPARFQIFVDGAHSEDGVGAAAVFFRRSRPLSSAGLTLGCSCCYTILDAELAAISLAIHMARDARIWDNLTIFSDSQQAVNYVGTNRG
ncbi:Putative 115 kDa protein in type-1 retrotransposable element R1DM AltName: Full=ORF 2 [Rhizoctonia solani AG-1 IB]|uniref:Rhizoctonia solani AG1-IB WGS project CAOJ00000000 data, isolate 7/3/14, contig 23199 n=1 Tax=Thanatephorus cucumeris (strain AG1-IB / isolate 7/3/14) TaxID=1108050 RepID=M5CCF8_THACB|nr:Putative 115 kDa protein in type-1 retrotransposable element R1DM AltName: Full=ORF 2 [Rhizoctonia solani AG-1 IB]